MIITIVLLHLQIFDSVILRVQLYIKVPTMPRKRRRKTVPRYDRDKLNDCVEEVKSGKTVYQVAKGNNVSLETLRRWVVSPPSKVGSGSRTVLSREEELLVATALQFLARCGFPQDSGDVRDMVQSYLTSLRRHNPFPDNCPGRDWMVLLERRHAHLLTRRNPEFLTKPRAEGLSPAVLDFFDKYTSLLDANNLADKPHSLQSQ